MKRRALATTVAVASLLAAPAQAGFLDFLFGRQAPAPVEEYRPATPVERPAARIAPAPKPQLTPEQQLARTIDPVKSPEWHLVDPTLKRGDILFLADRVVVFTGGRIGDPRSYSPLSDTRLVSKAERRTLGRMAGRTAPAASADRPERPKRTVTPALARLATSF